MICAYTNAWAARSLYPFLHKATMACLIQIQTCPAYYRLYKVDRNGVESTLCSGRRGTVYGVMRKVNEELSKNKK